jgi:hypothetical protein
VDFPWYWIFDIKYCKDNSADRGSGNENQTNSYEFQTIW